MWQAIFQYMTCHLRIVARNFEQRFQWLLNDIGKIEGSELVELVNVSESKPFSRLYMMNANQSFIVSVIHSFQEKCNLVIYMDDSFFRKKDYQKIENFIKKRRS